jgi:uncharacterized integral membrane protein (TIGR00697 family)
MNKEGMSTFILFIGIFSGCLTIAAVLASKIVNIFGFFVPAGVFAYCITFICTDVISELWGKRYAKITVLSGLSALIIALILIQIALYLVPAPFWHNQEEFASVLGMTHRVIIGSLVAYLVSQYHDVWMFHVLKKITKDKNLWLRNNLSTIISQFLDSVFFITIAFYGIMPIWPLIFGQWIIKIGIAALDTPIVYALVIMLRKKRVNDLEKSLFWT